MLVVAMVLACILNKKDLRFKGFFRTMIFLPCTTSLVAYAIIFRSLFANDGLESINLTDGGPANASISMSHYIYNLCFKYVPNFGYAAAMSFFILLLVAVLAFIQMRVGDKRD